MRNLLILVIFLITNLALSASISIPLNDSESSLKPANDLTYQGNTIDAAMALDLKERGVDISSLNPRISNLYRAQKLNLKDDSSFNITKPVMYLGSKRSPTEIFRFFALDENRKKFLFTASLDNHTNILRALLLRLLGFDINQPKLLKSTTVNFRSKDDKKKFLDDLSEQTLSSQKRWIIKESDKSVELRFIIIDKPELKNVNLYLPVMSRSRQTQRRLFRSLLAIYSITDFSESINKTSWSIGSVFNNNLTLVHPYASSFKNATEDDLKWILKKLNALSRKQIELIVERANYPKEVKALATEKLISRIVTLSQKLRVRTTLTPNTFLENQYVLAGELKDIDFTGHALNYSKSDVPSPYRFKELFRLFATQAVYSGLSSLIDKGLKKVIPGVYSDDAAQKIQDKMTAFRRDNPSANGNMPLKVFSAPTAYGKLFVNRNIIFGQVLDTNAPIQLVDSIGAEVNLGLQSRVTGVSQTIIPNLGMNTSFIRTYSHVRAMPDLKTATKQKIKNVLVPLLMKKLGRILKDEYECSISKAPYVEEKKIGEDTFYYVKYDSSAPKFKEMALIKRQVLIDEGKAANKILLVKIDRESLCSTDIEDTRNKSIDDFLRSFAENETFVISDSLRLNGMANVAIPVYANTSVSLGVDSSKALIRSILLKKVDDSIKVTIQEQNDNSMRFTESISFYIQLFRNSNLFVKGKQKAKVFNINVKEQDEAKKNIALKVIRNLFVRNNKALLYKHYKGEEVDHRVKARLHSLKFLWFKRDRFKMNHDLTVVVPNRGDEDFSLDMRKRTFFQHFDYRRVGSDFHSFGNDVLGFFSEIVTLGQASPDPGKTFMGNSKKIYFSTEAETTKGFEENPTTKVEIIRSGWSKKNSKINKHFSEVDQMFSFSKRYNSIDRSILSGADRLKSFDIRSTIILYPSAIERLHNKLLSATKRRQESLLNFLNDKNNKEPLRRRGKLVLKQLNKLAKSFISTKDKVREINKLYRILFTKFNKSKVLSLIGEDNFFAATRVMGFRESHHDGFLEYSSDTLGVYNKSIGTGVLDQLSSQLGVSSFQLRALNYSPGM